MTYSICPVTLQYHVIKGSFDFMKGSSSSGLVVIGTGVAARMLLIYHVASRDHVLKELCNFESGSFSW